MWIPFGKPWPLGHKHGSWGPSWKQALMCWEVVCQKGWRIEGSLGPSGTNPWPEATSRSSSSSFLGYVPDKKASESQERKLIAVILPASSGPLLTALYRECQQICIFHIAGWILQNWARQKRHWHLPWRVRVHCRGCLEARGLFLSSRPCYVCGSGTSPAWPVVFEVIRCTPY